MRFFFSLIGKIIFLLLLVIAHFFLSYILPFPYNTLNIVFAALVLFMLLSESGIIVWMAFFMHLCIELYSVSPFGIILLSSTLSILCTYWLFQYFFSNRSWYSAIFLTFIALFLYRTISLFLLSITYFIQKEGSVPWSNMVVLSGWELLFTEIIVLFGFAIIPQLRKNLANKRPKLL